METSCLSKQVYNLNGKLYLFIKFAYIINSIVGTSLDDAGSGRVFTHILKSVRKYVIHSNTVFLQFVVFGLNEKLKSGAVVKFERFGTH